METMKFPFSDAPNTACFTCCHVLEENKPILYVSHDEDGYWQFLCGGNHKEEDVRVVSLASIIKIDHVNQPFFTGENAGKNVFILTCFLFYALRNYVMMLINRDLTIRH